MTVLLTAMYVDPHPARAQEISECFALNLQNPLIDLVVGFWQEPRSSLNRPTMVVGDRGENIRGLRVHYLHRRATYNEFFEFIDRASYRYAGTTAIVANNDIHFDETLAALRDYDLTGKMLCLTRWEPNHNGLWEVGSGFGDSGHNHDAWIFKSPLPKMNCDWYPGTLGCENRMAYEAEKAGLAISNPSLSIRANHNHRSNVRYYSTDEWVPGTAPNDRCAFHVLGPPTTL